MKPVVEVQNLSKLYRLGDIGASSLRESLETFWGRLRGRQQPRPNQRKEQDRLIEPSRRGPYPGSFWSLHDVSFSVTPGEVDRRHRPQRRG
ncbi:MAG: hypothetical protein QM796_02825 [Chthoniobacteraceae bacterium]